MKKLLVVIDYQNDFVSGSLGFKEAIALEDYIANLINEYHQSNQEIIFTLDTHLDNYLDTQEGKNLPVVHCLKNTEGWQLYGRINELANHDKKICKTTFGSLELGNYLANNHYDEITFVGVVSNICVLSNAIIAKAALPEAKISIDCNGISSNDLLLQEKALDLLANLQFIIKR